MGHHEEHVERLGAEVLGDTVVIKASERTSRTHGLVAACSADAGFPAGVVNLLTTAPEDAACSAWR